MNVWLVQELEAEDISDLLERNEEDIIELLDEMGATDLDVADVEAVADQLIGEGVVFQEDSNEIEFEVLRIILEEDGYAYDTVEIETCCADTECECSYDVLKMI